MTINAGMDGFQRFRDSTSRDVIDVAVSCRWRSQVSRHSIEKGARDVNHREWLDRYRRAWVERDAGAAAGLFTEDAIYRERPFDPPLSGRDAIRRYWSAVTQTQSSIELRYGSPVIQGGRVAVEWWANLVNDGSPMTLAGEFLLAFDDDGRCRELREYWTVTEGRVEPPSGWGA